MTCSPISLLACICCFIMPGTYDMFSDLLLACICCFLMPGIVLLFDFPEEVACALCQ